MGREKREDEVKIPQFIKGAAKPHMLFRSTQTGPVIRRKIMQVKQVKIRNRSVDDLDNFVATGEAIERGEAVKKQPAGVSFSDLDAFHKALTQKRLQLLHVIRQEKPTSIHNLAQIVRRDSRNVFEDVKYLTQIGLLELKVNNDYLFPIVDYERIQLIIEV